MPKNSRQTVPGLFFGPINEFLEVKKRGIRFCAFTLIFFCAKGHLTLQWKGLNLHSKGRVLKIARLLMGQDT